MVKENRRTWKLFFINIVLLISLSILVNVTKFLFPGIISRLLIPFYFIIPVITVCAGNIYRHNLKRNTVFAPEYPYDYRKMATLHLTKDETTFLKKHIIL
ncbi:MAG: hypothetical protein R3Y24_03355 [Eubacteriales bacterium]